MEKKIECKAGKASLYKLSKRVSMIRVDDNSTKFFEGLWEIPEGITYNSYIVFGDESVAVLDTVKEGFWDCYSELLSSVIEPKSIRYVIVHHSEPDHSGVLPNLLSVAGSVRVLAHPIARSIVESRYGITLEHYQPLRDNLSIDLGGVVLRFISTPWLHWPDTFMSFLEGEGVLFSGDVFGAYSIPDSYVDRGIDFDKYSWFMKKYFATVIGRYREWVVKNLPKIRSLSIKRIAPLHGLILEEHVWDAIRLYETWGYSRVDPDKALVVYTSMYGVCGEACRRLASMLAEEGVEVKVYGFDDKSRPAISDVVAEALDSGIIVLCVPTYEASAMPLAVYLAELICSKASAGQSAAIVSSYGWGGAAARVLRQTLESCGLKVKAVVEVKGRPSDSVLREAVGKLLE